MFLMILMAAGMLACEAREEVEREAREEALEEMEMGTPCELTGQWAVEETLSGGTCNGERLTARRLRIAIEDQRGPLAISLTRGEIVFEDCAGTRALEGCAFELTCSAEENLDAGLELELTSDGHLSGQEILTYRDGSDVCNVELALDGVRVPEATPQ